MLMPQEAKTKVPGPITLEITEPYTTMQCATLKPVAAAVGGANATRQRGRGAGYAGEEGGARREQRAEVMSLSATPRSSRAEATPFSTLS